MRLRHIRHHFFENLVGNVIVFFPTSGNGAVFPVLLLIKLGHIDPGNFCRTVQKVLPRTAGTPVFYIPVQQGTVLRLSFADIEQIKEIRNRFWIVNAGAAPNYDGHIFPAVSGQKRNL